MQDSNEAAAYIHGALVRLGYPETAEVRDIHMLTGGQSGSSVTAFRLDGVPVVLKGAVLGGQGESLLRRERREVMFYREIAAGVPVAVPRMLRSALDEGGSPLLLLAASEPAPEPNAWSGSDFTEVARQLGRFHSAMQGVVLPDWVRSAVSPSQERCRNAANAWRAFATDNDAGIVPASLLSRVEQLMSAVPTIEDRENQGPATLCHGDFHAGNFLRDVEGGWIWADWHEVHAGPGVDDFAFFWERAFAATDAKNEPPYAAMVDAYWDGLGETGVPSLSREALDRALAWSELRGWLIEWPPYLGYLSREQQARVIERIGAVAVMDWWDGHS